MITLKEITQVLAVEMIFYPQVMLDEKLATAWHMQFKDCTPQEFQSALHMAVQKNKSGFPPTPGSVREIISESRKTPDDMETAEEAWHGMFKRNQGSARAKAAARLMHDWSNKDRWDYDTQVPWKQKEYIRIYNGLKNKDEILGIKQEMTGIENHGNEKLSHITNGLIKKLGA